MILNFKNTILRSDSSIADAIKSLNKSRLNVILVLDKNKKYIGTITDGDIRRHLTDNLNLKTKISKITNKSSKFLIGRNSRDSIIDLMLKYKIQRLPILNQKRFPIKLILIEDFINKINNDYPIVIMAGGRGKRMMPLTKKVPKPMLRINNKPIIKHIIEKAKIEGFKNFFISVNYLGDKIINYLKDGKKFNINIEYLKEVRALGTAGSLSILRKSIGSPILITNGDIITDLNYKNLINFHIKNKADLTVSMGLQQYENPFGIINAKGVRLISLIEKPITYNYVNAGIYVLNSDLINYIPKMKKMDMPELLKILSRKKKKICVYPILEKWFDIGDKNKLKLINEKKN